MCSFTINYTLILTELDGLWVYNNPIPPWGFRHSKKKRPDNYKGPYHGNISSHIFHAPWCKYFNCKNCTKIFKNKKSAVNAGYRQPALSEYPCALRHPPDGQFGPHLLWWTPEFDRSLNHPSAIRRQSW